MNPFVKTNGERLLLGMRTRLHWDDGRDEGRFIFDEGPPPQPSRFAKEEGAFADLPCVGAGADDSTPLCEGGGRTFVDASRLVSFGFARTLGAVVSPTLFASVKGSAMRTVINSRDLEENMDRLLQRVEDGESMDITRHGRIVARLIPPDRQLVSTDEEQERLWAALSEKARRIEE